MTEKALTLSIVIPVYNEERHLKACLDAIDTQTVKADQVIVVDNNSTDKSAEIAKSYPFVTLVNESKQGIAYARDRGFNSIQSDLIGRIDADTILSPNWVEYAVKFMSSHPETLLTGGCYMYDLKLPKFFGWIQGQIAFRANRFILGYYIGWGSNMVLTTTMWQAVREAVSHRNDIHEDMDLSILVHKKGYKISYHTDFKVGIDSRLFARHGRQTHMTYLKMWPQTLRQHNIKQAWLGDVGVYLVYVSYIPLLWLNKLVQFVKK